MGLKLRIIPVVTWNGLGAVQTVQFRNPRLIGSMQQVLSVYEQRTCDELMILDITASDEGRSPNVQAMARFAEGIFCPLTVGGGVTEVGQAVELIRHGADKIVVGDSASSVLGPLSDKIGSQSVVFALDWKGDAEVFPVQTTATSGETLGAGEILLTSVERQGTMAGYDLDLIRKTCAAVKVPVVAHGGCGHPAHMLDAIRAGAHAVAAGTMFAFTEWTPRSCAKWLRMQGIAVRMD